MKRIALCIVGICHLTFSSAQNPSDSIKVGKEGGLPVPMAKNFGQRLDKFSSSRLYQMTYIGVPLVVGGLIVKGEDDHFRNLRNEYLPRFNRHLDDYMQYAPAVAMLGLKASGVQSRSSWGRLLVSDAFSALLMGATVNTLKQTTNVERPDGSNRHSFPSGHTSNAFLGAHMAYKEFKDSSPILAYSGYAIAAFVAGSRLYNNRHWVADVVAGAGFGILSVELSYLIYFPIRNAIARRINRNVKNCPIVAAPVFSSNMAGFYLTYQF